ncbi:hypothetical protein BC829DRAFT_383011 [Chytridium lagenaria]|nr:hypothetical protein BC829DRAFT_383011 [Chytridium lagenaria]
MCGRLASLGKLLVWSPTLCFIVLTSSLQRPPPPFPATSSLNKDTTTVFKLHGKTKTVSSSCPVLSPGTKCANVLQGKRKTPFPSPQHQ